MSRRPAVPVEREANQGPAPAAVRHPSCDTVGYRWTVPFRRKHEEAPSSADARLATMYDERVADHDRTHVGYGAAWAEFVAVVLRHGGRLVVPPPSPDPLLDMLRTEGRVWRGDVTLRPLQQSDCHRNAVSLWRDGEAPGVGTGYALSDDGLWREHSWGVGARGELLETTEDRRIYFGIEFKGEDVQWFADWTDPGGGEK